MQVIHFMKFTPVHSDQFYMVGTDISKMRATAKAFDATADRGEIIDSERVLAAADTDRRHQAFERGVAAARAGATDHYLFG